MRRSITKDTGPPEFVGYPVDSMSPHHWPRLLEPVPFSLDGLCERGQSLDQPPSREPSWHPSGRYKCCTSVDVVPKIIDLKLPSSSNLQTNRYRFSQEKNTVLFFQKKKLVWRRHFVQEDSAEGEGNAHTQAFLTRLAWLRPPVPTVSCESW